MRAHDLVLLHGQPGLGQDWQRVIDRLPAALRGRAMAPDRPGHGSSKLPGGGFDYNAQVVLDDLDARGVRRAVLVGHSYGGGVALTVAARAPDRVQALILLAAIGPGCLNGWDRLLAAPGAGEVCSLVAWQLTPWAARARLRRLAKQASTGSVDEVSSQHVNWHVWGHTRWEHGPLWRTFLTEQRALMRDADNLARLAMTIGAPSLILADPADSMVPFRTAKSLLELLPDAALRQVPGAGHHLPLRAPDQVAQEMVAFLTALGRARPSRPDAQLLAS